jgi:hypothetical protein
MFAITLVAVAAAVAAWLRPMPEAKSPAPSAPTFSAQQVADSKSKVCAAYAKIHRAVDVNAPRNGGNDPTSQLAVATNMRQIYVVGSAYLLTELADEPATPSDLAATTGKVARLLQVLTIEGSVSDPSVEAYNEVNQTGTAIESLCK